MPATTCKAGALLDLADPADRDLLARLLDGEPDNRGRAIPATHLSVALGAVGHPVSATAVKDHRGGRCVCRD